MKRFMQKILSIPFFASPMLLFAVSYLETIKYPVCIQKKFHYYLFYLYFIKIKELFLYLYFINIKIFFIFIS
jgi:hypothetical protein